MTRLLLLLTAGALLVLLLLGLSLQLGWRRDVARWPHHALFFVVCGGVLAAALMSGWRGLALLPALASLLTMPRTRPGQRNHWQRALACMAAFTLGTLWLWPRL